MILYAQMVITAQNVIIKFSNYTLIINIKQNFVLTTLTIVQIVNMDSIVLLHIVKIRSD
jgi:hypothetical protein